jgi:glycosyltransferase involved in cell wall biosynthesis
MISVVIPVYNQGAHLERAVDAFLAQRRPPDEIIIVDDASTDDTPARLARIAGGHRQVRVMGRSRNGGPNAAIGDGLAQAAGRFVTAAAADDIVLPGFLERSVAALTAHPDAALCFSDPGELIGDTGVARDHALGIGSEATYFAPQELARLMRLNMFSISSNTVVYRREALLAVGGFRRELAWHADWFANLVLGFRHGACYVPEVLARFRVQPGSYSWSGARDRAGQKKLLHDVIDLLQRQFPDVYPLFRDSALVPEMRLRGIFWLLRSPAHRRYLTARLAGRLVAREAWSYIRPLTPLGVRRRMRRISGRLTSTARG